MKDAMKLIVCGKGGSGKSTVAALLAKHYAGSGRRVLVVDTDESNANLYRLLGLDAPGDLLDYFGGKKKLMESMRIARREEFRNPLDCKWAIGNLPDGYVSSKDRIHLCAIGKIQRHGEGCACPMGVLARQFLSGLQLSGNDIVIIDTEAGVEHFGRGIDGVCNSILMVIDPSYESVHLAERVATMTEEINVPLFYVLNKTDHELSRVLRQRIHARERIIGEIPQECSLLATGLAGEEIKGMYPVAGIIAAAIDKSMQKG